MVLWQWLRWGADVSGSCSGGAALMMLTTAFVDSDALSKNLSDSLREAEQQFKQGLLNVQYEINRVERMFDADPPIGFIHRLFGIPYFGTQFR